MTTWYRTVDGDYVNLDRVDVLNAHEASQYDKDKGRYHASAWVGDEEYVLAVFDTLEDAQRELEDIVGDPSFAITPEGIKALES